MNNKLTGFQMAFLGAMVILIMVGVAFFSMNRSGESSNPRVDIVAWGTLPEDIIGRLIREINQNERNSVTVDYVQIPVNTFEAEFVDALAAGRGPDIVLLSTDYIIRHENKLFTIPYESYPQRTFRERFIEAGDVLLDGEGIIGVPYIIDPLVLYWNRSLLNSASIPQPPRYWDQLVEMTPRLSEIGDNLRVNRSAISLGEYRNIRHAKDIIITLTKQSGSPVIQRNTNKNDSSRFVNTFASALDFPVRPANAALNFYTQFSNPSLNTYSWNRSLPTSDEAFLAGTTAFYIGYASEYQNLRQRNPNLNFDVAVLPQSRASDEIVNMVGKKTLGRLMFWAITNNTPHVEAAFININNLTSQQNINLLTEHTNLPPVRRDSLAETNSNAILQIFYDSAIIAVPFLDPQPQATEQIFSEMIESVTSGRSNESTSVIRAGSQIEDLLR